jgi:hypothetical protein
MTGMRPAYVYVASSWRNHLQPVVVAALRAAGIDCYDFKNPEPNTGFHWSEVSPDYGTCRCDHDRLHGLCRAHGETRRYYDPGHPDAWACTCPRPDVMTQSSYMEALQHPRSVEGFDSDFAAMQKADTFVLVLPCGRSAHLELGWAVGAGKRTAILLEDPCTPELMYRMVDYLAPSLLDLLGWLGVED